MFCQSSFLMTGMSMKYKNKICAVWLLAILTLAMPQYVRSQDLSVPTLNIDGMFPSQRNRDVLRILELSDGKIVFLERVYYEFQNFEPYNSLLKNCYADDKIFDGLFNDRTLSIPIPLSIHRTDEDTSKDGSAYKKYDCEYTISFSMLNTSKLPRNSIGTGSGFVVVRKPFLVNHIRSGYLKIFALREVPTNTVGSGEACARFPNLCR
jgi:hypothetical protein